MTAATWGTMVLEFCLALGLILPRRRWRPLLLAGLALHAGIGLLMGLWSFALAMAGALVLFLHPWEKPFTLPAQHLARLRRQFRPTAMGVLRAPTGPVAPLTKIVLMAGERGFARRESCRAVSSERRRRRPPRSQRFGR